MSSHNYLNVKSWSVGQVVSWVGGLGECLSKHMKLFEQKSINGCRLLIMTNGDLLEMGITGLDDQETILKGIILLQKMTYDMSHESLKFHASRLEVACGNLIGLVKLTIPSSQNVQDLKSVLKSKVDILVSIENVLKYIFSMISWMERLHFEKHKEQKQFLILKAGVLGDYPKKKVSESQLLNICHQLIEVCEKIITDFNDPLSSQPSSFDTVQLIKNTDEKLGLEIRCLHNEIPSITSVKENSLAASIKKFEVGDEIIQINEQNILGWDMKILKQMIESKGNEVKFILRKRPTLFYMLSNANKQEHRNKIEKSKNDNKKDFQETSSSDNELLKGNSKQEGNMFGMKSLEDLQMLDSRLYDEFQECNEIAGDVLFYSVEEGFLTGSKEMKDMLSPSWSPQDDKRGYFLSSNLDQNNAKFPSILRKSKKNRANKRISCLDLGGTDCEGWLWVKSEAKGKLPIADKWTILWIILKSRTISFYKDPKDASPMKSFSLVKCGFSPQKKTQNKFTFKVWNERDSFMLASDHREDMLKWMNKMTLASLEDLNAEDLHIIGGFQKSHRYIAEPDQPTEVNELEPLDVPEDLKRIYIEILSADVGINGRNIKERRSAMLTASTSLKEENSLNMLKLLSLNRMLKDKTAKLESIENFLKQAPVTPETLNDFQHKNPFCTLSTPSDHVIV